MTKTPCFHREALVVLKEWRQRRDRRALVVKGARQVGKTVLARMFSAEFPRYAELNLALPNHAALFKRGLAPRDLAQAIMLECGVPSTPEPLLLFLDEIQDCPEALPMLGHLHEALPDIFLMAAGSLLEVALDAARIAFPVGRVEYLYLRPMTFGEFLLTVDGADTYNAYATIPSPPFAADRLSRLFHLYAVVGGMPAAVERYVASGGDLVMTGEIHSLLFAAYRDDIPKYARNQTLRHVQMHCLESAPHETGKRVVFHGFGGSNYRSREVGEALRTLERAMMLTLLHPTTQTAPPFMPNHRKAPRMQFLDVGLLSHQLGMRRHLLGVEDLNETCRGRITEQMVGQELLAAGINETTPPIFWVREKPQSQAEVDFLLNTQFGAIPVEVKSGKAGKMRSLHQFMEMSDSPLAIRLYAGRVELQEVVYGDFEYKLLNLPYWAAGQLIEWIKVVLAEGCIPSPEAI